MRIVKIDEMNRLLIEDMPKGFFIFQQGKGIFNKWTTFNSLYVGHSEAKELVEYFAHKIGYLTGINKKRKGENNGME